MSLAAAMRSTSSINCKNVVSRGKTCPTACPPLFTSVTHTTRLQYLTACMLGVGHSLMLTVLLARETENGMELADCKCRIVIYVAWDLVRREFPVFFQLLRNSQYFLRANRLKSPFAS
jgi:hypothetical protein